MIRVVIGKVVVADDSDLDRELTRRAFRKWAPEVTLHLFEDGESALEFLRESRDINLVLLDHRMPRLGAVEVLEGLGRERAETPFVLFSSAVSPSQVAKCSELGVKEYVEKPTDPGEYAEVIHQMVTRYLA